MSRVRLSELPTRRKCTIFLPVAPCCAAKHLPGGPRLTPQLSLTLRCNGVDVAGAQPLVWVYTQAELALVTAAVRARLMPLLESVRADLGLQRAAAAERDAQTEVVKDYILVRVLHSVDVTETMSVSRCPHGRLFAVHAYRI